MGKTDVRQKLLRALISAILAALTLIYPALGAALPVATDSQSVLMLSLDTGERVFSKGADVRRPPASLTKIMTALVTLESCSDIESEKITVPETELFKEIIEDGGVTMDLKTGESLSVKDLLYAMMLSSACDAAQLLAWHFGGGDVNAFVKKMNDKAEALGMENTNFVNPHGLEAPLHYSSAEDIALCAIEALKNPAFSEIVSHYSYQIPETEKSKARSVYYTIAMLNPDGKLYYPGLVGVKSGYTSQAGRCLVTTAERDGSRYLLVVMGANLTTIDSNNLAYTDTAAIYDYAFSNLETRTLIEADKEYATVTVNGSDVNEVSLKADKDVSVICQKGAEPRYVVNVPEELNAPVEAGKLGTLEVYVSDELVAGADLINDVEALPVSADPANKTTPYTLAPQGNIFTNDHVTVILLIVLAVVILAAVFTARLTKKKTK